MYVILVDMRKNNDGVVTVHDEDDNISIFKDFDEVQIFLKKQNSLCKIFPFFLVDIGGIIPYQKVILLR